jgi:ketosteroid isomerase-like protein
MESEKNVVSFREAAAAFASGDFARWLDEFDDSMELHLPPALHWHPGTSGPAALKALWQVMFEWSDGHYDHEIVKIDGLGGLVVTLNRVKARRGAKSRTYNTTWTYRYVGGRVKEAWLVSSLEDAELAEFWDRAPAEATAL